MVDYGERKVFASLVRQELTFVVRGLFFYNGCRIKSIIKIRRAIWEKRSRY